MKNTTLCYIERDGRYLLLHRVKKENDLNRDKWVGIGGKFEENESPEECLLREVREETGLTGIKLMDGFRESVEYSPKPGVKKQVVYFLGTTEQEKLMRQEEEISEIMWAPLRCAADLVSFANDKRLLRHAQRRLGLLPAEPEPRPDREEATE